MTSPEEAPPSLTFRFFSPSVLVSISIQSMHLVWAFAWRCTILRARSTYCFAEAHAACDRRAAISDSSIGASKLCRMNSPFRTMTKRRASPGNEAETSRPRPVLHPLHR